MRPVPYTIELVGIPGAGKTWMSRLLADHLSQRVATALPGSATGAEVPPHRRLPRKARFAGAQTLARPRLSIAVGTALGRSRQPSMRDTFGRLVQWQLAQHQLRMTDNASRVRIIDEGVLQSMWSVALRGDVEPMLAALEGPTPWLVPDLVVAVRTDPEEALRRLAERLSRHSRTQGLDPSRQLSELHHGDALLGRLLRWWNETAGGLCDVLQVSGSANAGAEQAAAACRIRRLALRAPTGRTPN